MKPYPRHNYIMYKTKPIPASANPSPSAGEELSKIVKEAVKEAVAPLLAYLQANAAPQLVTRKELAEMLSISLPTIHDWVRKGLLTPQKAGRRTLFDLAEVRAKLEAGQLTRYSHLQK